MQNVEIDALGLQVGFVLFGLEKGHSSDSWNLFHDDCCEQFLYDSRHEEFFETQGYFNSDLATATAES